MAAVKQSLSRSKAWTTGVVGPVPGITFIPRTVGKVQHLTPFRQEGGGIVCLHVVAEGAGFVQCGTRTQAVGTGEVFCVMPDRVVGYWDEPGSVWTYYWLLLEGKGALPFVNSLGFSDEEPWVVPRDPGVVLDAFQSAMETLSHCDSTSLYSLISQVFRIADGCRHFSGEGGERAAVLTSRATQYAETHLHQGINISDIAARLRVDRSTLYNAFRKQLGLSPMKWLQQLRMERAIRLLADSACALDSVARTCGFADTNYFIKAFHKHTGTSPGRYRSNHAFGVTAGTGK